MSNNNDWFEILKDKFDEEQTPPPKKAWESIEKKLFTKHKFIFLNSWFLTAVAILFIGSTITFFYFNNKSSNQLIKNTNNTNNKVLLAKNAKGIKETQTEENATNIVTKKKTIVESLNNIDKLTFLKHKLLIEPKKITQNESINSTPQIYKQVNKQPKQLIIDTDTDYNENATLLTNDIKKENINNSNKKLETDKTDLTNHYVNVEKQSNKYKIEDETSNNQTTKNIKELNVVKENNKNSYLNEALIEENKTGENIVGNSKVSINNSTILPEIVIMQLNTLPIKPNKNNLLKPETNLYKLDSIAYFQKSKLPIFCFETYVGIGKNFRKYKGAFSTEQVNSKDFVDRKLPLKNRSLGVLFQITINKSISIRSGLELGRNKLVTRWFNKQIINTELTQNLELNGPDGSYRFADNSIQEFQIATTDTINLRFRLNLKSGYLAVPISFKYSFSNFNKISPYFVTGFELYLKGKDKTTVQIEGANKFKTISVLLKNSSTKLLPMWQIAMGLESKQKNSFSAFGEVLFTRPLGYYFKNSNRTISSKLFQLRLGLKFII